jgi:outer membrane protein assembly factor BamB
MTDVISELRARVDALEPSIGGLADLRNRRRRRNGRRRVAAATVGLGVVAGGVLAVARIATLEVETPQRPPITASTVGDLRLAWERRLGPVAGAASGEGIVVVAQRDGRVVALEPASGRPRWSAMLGAEILAAPAVGDGVVVVQGADGTLRAFDVGCDGPCEPRWTAPTGARNGEPVIGDGVVAVVGDDGLLTVFPVECSDPCVPSWTTEVGGTDALERWLDRVSPLWPSEPRSRPAIGDGLLWDASDGILRAFPVECRDDGGACTPAAVLRAGGVERFTSPPAIVGDRLVIVSTASLVAYDVACASGGSCDQLWRAPLGAINTALPTAAGSTVVFAHPASTHEVVAYPAACDPVDGRCEPIWRSEPGRTTTADPIVVGDVVLTSSLQTGFEAFPVDCSRPCQPLTAIQASEPGSIVSPSGYLVILVGGDGSLRAFGVPPR